MKPPLCMTLLLLLEVSLVVVVTATDCRSALGVESGVIRDDQFSASSSYVILWQPWDARLNSGSAWYPRQDSTSEWLQVDLLERTSITGIQTQGDLFNIWSYYVTSFKLLYSDNGATFNWNTLQENGSDKIFEGNSDAVSVKTNYIDPPIVTRFIRLMAVTWQRGIAFRLELLGCEIEPTTTSAAMPTTVTLPTTEVETTVHIFVATSALKTATMQTTSSPSVTTYSVSSTKETSVTPEGITLFTPAVPQKSSSISSGPEVTSPSSTNTSGNSDGLADNPVGTASAAVIGGAVAAVVVIIIIAILVSIFFIRRRRSKDTGERETDHQPDETGTVDNIYYCGVSFAANGNASTDGIVSIGQSEGTVDNHLYAGTTNDNIPIDQSEGTVDNHLYAGAGGPSAEIRRQTGDDSAQDNIYYNVAQTSDTDYVENEIY